MWSAWLSSFDDPFYDAPSGASMAWTISSQKGATLYSPRLTRHPKTRRFLEEARHPISLCAVVRRLCPGTSDREGDRREGDARGDVARMDHDRGNQVVLRSRRAGRSAARRPLPDLYQPVRRSGP